MNGSLSQFDLSQEAKILTPIETFDSSSIIGDSFVSFISLKPDKRYALIQISETVPPKNTETVALFDLQSESSDYFKVIKVLPLHWSRRVPSYYAPIGFFCTEKNSILLAYSSEIAECSIFDATENLTLPSLVLKIKLLREEDPSDLLKVPYFNDLCTQIAK